MPEIKQYYRNVAPIPSAGNAIAPSDLGLAPYAETARAGAIMSDIGLAAIAETEKAEAANQFNQAKVDALRQMDEYELSLATNNDTSAYEQGASDTIAKIKDSTKIKNPRAADAFNQWFSGESQQYKTRIAFTRIDRAADIIEKERQGRAEYYTWKASQGDQRAVSMLISDAIDTGAARLNLTDEQKQGIADGTIKSIPSESLEPVPGNEGAFTELMTNLAKIDEGRQKVLKEQVGSAIENKMTDIASKTDENGVVIGKWSDAVKWLSKPETIKEIKEQTGADFDTIKKAMDDAKAFGLAQSDEIATNDLVRYGLKNMSLDIWRGTTTKRKFDEQLNAARVGIIENGKRVYKFGDVVSDEPLLKEQDYKELGDSAATELRKSQAEDISRYTRDTANVILGPVASNLFTTDEQGNFILNPNALGGGDKEQAKYLLNFVNQYEDELREWIAKNPDKSGREFYTFAQEKKYEYWNTSLDQIKQRTNTLKQSEALKGIPKKNGLYAPLSQEQAEALPSGTEFIAPDGKKRRKP